MKLSLTFAILLVTVLSAAAEHYGSHNATWGMRKYDDHLLRAEFVEMKSKFMRVVSKDYYFNQTCGMFPQNITVIKVTDLYTNGKGGYATLVQGGPRFTFAKIHFKSQRDHGFKFLVDIYGY